VKKITAALILLLSVLTIGIKKANAFDLREVDASVHTGQITSFRGLQDSVSDWHRLNIDVNLKADVFTFSKFATVGAIVKPSFNLSEDIHAFQATIGAYVNPFNNRHVELYYQYTDSYDTRNKLNQNFSFSNNEIGIRFIIIRR